MEELFDIAAVRDMVRTMQELGKALCPPKPLIPCRRLSLKFQCRPRRQSYLLAMTVKPWDVVPRPAGNFKISLKSFSTECPSKIYGTSTVGDSQLYNNIG